MRFKNLVSLLLVLLLSGALSAEPTAAKIEGKLQAAGPSIYMEGSHELVDADGELVARVSGNANNVDLDAHKGEWVCLTGEWRPTVEAGGKIFEVQSVGAIESKSEKH